MPQRLPSNNSSSLKSTSTLFHQVWQPSPALDGGVLKAGASVPFPRGNLDGHGAIEIHGNEFKVRTVQTVVAVPCAELAPVVAPPALS